MELMTVARGLVLAAPAIGFGLVVVWAALSRALWVWRCGAVLLVCGLLLPTVAHSVAIVALISGGGVVLLAMVVRSLVELVRTRQWPVFQLTELLLATAVVAAAAGIVSYSLNHSPPPDWPLLLGVAGAYALSLIAVLPAVRFAANRWWWSVIFLAAFIPLVVGYALLWQWLNWYELDEWWLMGGMYWPPTITEIAAAGQMIVMGLLLAVWSLRNNVAAGAEEHGRRKLRRASSAFVVVVLLPFAYATVGLYYEMLKPPTPYPAGPSGENYYDELTALAKPLLAVSLDDADNCTLQELVDFRDEHRERLSSLEALLDKPCYVPLAISKQHWMNDLDSLNAVRGLMYTYIAVGEIHERHSDNDAAADEYLKIIKFADGTSRGGLNIDALIAAAVEAVAINRLRAIRGELSAAQCKSLARRLEEFDRGREGWAVIEQRDRAWMIHIWGWQTRLQEILQPEGYDGYVHIRNAELRRYALFRLAATELAILAFKAENDRWPANLEELVPKYLAAVPEDPYSAGPLRYRLIDDHYTLYSVGRNGRDDGGKFIGLSKWHLAEPGDYQLDAFDIDEKEEEAEQAQSKNSGQES